MTNIKTIRPFTIFPYRVFGKPDLDMPTFHNERSIVFASRLSPASKFLYERLYNDLGIFISKMPESYAKKYVSSVFTRKLILIGIGSESRTGIIGGVSITNKDSLAGIILDSKELDLNIETGQILSIDSWFYGAYFEFIRAAIIIHENEIRRDQKLHHLVIKYLFFLTLKFIGSDIRLNDKQKTFLQFVCGYFYYRFMLENPHLKSKELSLTDITEDFRDEADSLTHYLEKYSQMKDIFKAFVDYKIVDISPALLMMKILTKFKPTVFYSLISSLDYLIALSIVSYYPASFLGGAFINNDIPQLIEKHLDHYLKTVKFDVTAYQHI